LQVLLAAIDQGSLTAAASALSLGQSTVSRRLARLESLLGARLLDRTPEGVRPTELAERLAPHAELIAEHMDNIQRVVADQEEGVRGRVRLAVPDGLGSDWLIPRMQSLFDAYPELEVDILSGTAIVDLVRREADLALRFVAPTHPELLVRRVARMKLAPWIHPRLAGRGPKQMRWIKLIDPEGNYLETQWIRRHAKGAPVMRVNSWNALFAGVREGLGAGILSPLVAEAAGLLPLDDVPRVGHRDLMLVYHPALREVPRIGAVRDWLIEHAPLPLNAR
jgi:DNA-binding transcriptional LysR family regulator